MYIYIHIHRPIHIYTHTNTHKHTHTHTHIYIYTYIDIDIDIYINSGRNSRARMAICFSNCLGCNSKLNLSSKFHAEIATHLPHLNLRALHTLNIVL